jgi:hypothetical protein
VYSVIRRVNISPRIPQKSILPQRTMDHLQKLLSKLSQISTTANLSVVEKPPCHKDPISRSDKNDWNYYSPIFLSKVLP